MQGRGCGMCTNYHCLAMPAREAKEAREASKGGMGVINGQHASGLRVREN